MKAWRKEKENLSWVEEDQIREQAKQTYVGPWDLMGCTLQVLMELADVIVKSLYQSLNDSDDLDSHLKTQKISLLYSKRT